MSKFSFFRTLLIVSVSCLAGGILLYAAISQFPYRSDFVKDASDWKKYWLYNNELTMFEEQRESPEWIFDNHAGKSCPVLAGQNLGSSGLLPTLFSPEFYFEKQAHTDYVLKLDFFVPEESGLPAGHSFIIRAHKTDAAGEPFALDAVPDEDSYCDFPAAVTYHKNGIAQSIYLGKIEGGPSEGNSSYRFHLLSEQLSESGNYRFAIIEDAGGGNAGLNCRIYVTGFSVDKVVGVDLAAGQLIAPHSAPDAGMQPVSFFVRNLSGYPVNEITASYQVDDGRVITQTFSGLNLKPEGITALTFNDFNFDRGRHHIRFWTDMANEYRRENDSSQTYYFDVANIISADMESFHFSSFHETYSWSLYSDSLELDPLWQFDMISGSHAPAVCTEKKEAVGRHNDWLVSPYLEFAAEKYYKISVDYRAEVEDAVGDKSLSVWLVESNERKDVVNAAGEKLWEGSTMKHAGVHRATFFYHSRNDVLACLAVRNNNLPSDGYIVLNSLSIQVLDTNHMNFVYDFDPYTGADAVAQAASYMTVMDQDGNVSPLGKTSCWAVEGNSTGNYSVYSIHAEGLQGRADDWLVFNPFYLEKGVTYYLSMYAKLKTAGRDADLELYLQPHAPQYNKPYASQPGLKKQVNITSASNYTLIKNTVTVNQSGLYFLSIRNVTDVPNDVEDIVASEYGVYLDNVVFSDKDLASSAQAVACNVPYGAHLGRTVPLSITVHNFSMSELHVDYCYTIDGINVVKQQSDIGVLAIENRTFDQLADFGGTRDHTVSFWVETRGSSDPVDTLSVFCERIYPKELPYEEDFNAERFQQWQNYPATSSLWYLLPDGSKARSGMYSVACRGAGAGEAYLVTPIMRVALDSTYRIAFYARRGQDEDPGDSIRLYYAYNQFDQSGFEPLGISFPVEKEAYGEYVAYVKFESEDNDAEDADVFLAFSQDLAAGSSQLYLDDFSIIDSVTAHASFLSIDTVYVPESVAYYDTSGKNDLNFWLKSTSFLTVDPARIAYNFDGGPAIKTVAGAVERDDSIYVKVPPQTGSGNRLSEGLHNLTLWADMPNERDRTNDTVRTEFYVAGAGSYPYKESFDSVVYGTGAVDVNGDGRTWDIYRDAQAAYGGKGCLRFRHKNYKAGDVFFTNAFKVEQKDLGRRCVGFHIRSEEGNGNEKFGLRLMKFNSDGGFASAVVLDSIDTGKNYELEGSAVNFTSAGTYAIAIDYFSEGVEDAYYIDELFVDTVPSVHTPVDLRATVNQSQGNVAVTCKVPETRKVLHLYGKKENSHRYYAWKGDQPFTLDLSELRQGAEYVVKVRALSFIRDSGQWSEPYTFVTPRPAVPQNLRAVIDNDSVRFTNTGNYYSRVLHITGEEGAFDRCYKWTSVNGPLTVALSEFRHFHTYQASVVNITARGDSSLWSVPVNFTTPKPVAPLDLAAVVNEGENVAFTCTSEYSKKQLRIYTGSDPAAYYEWNGKSALTLAWDLFHAGKDYTAEVRAVTVKNDTSDWSARAAFSTPALPVPEDLNAFPGKQNIDFTCRGGLDNKVLRVVKSTGGAQFVFAWKGDKLTVKAAVLEPETYYKATVASVNAIGDTGAWSEPVLFKTLEKDPNDASATEDNEMLAGGKLSVRPNPVQNVLHMQLPEWARRWVIYDMRGREMVSGPASQTEVDVQMWPQGVYLLRAEGVSGRGAALTDVEKIIKK